MWLWLWLWLLRGRSSSNRGGSGRSGQRDALKREPEVRAAVDRRNGVLVKRVLDLGLQPATMIPGVHKRSIVTPEYTEDWGGHR
ncbi:hypothetical protein BCR34DRAFT_575724 [Clohesyomyces aquaticus]|uniref:Uncharacterized protein n=1 Tax=Clohesyomyces aquaticus TaxID=1231657 RepID=A0A1Y1YRU1_9PLEO|nr:hypothetical protein BCR34DRAFT_575724 [Clohesyomyces aquaticus]